MARFHTHIVNMITANLLAPAHRLLIWHSVRNHRGSMRFKLPRWINKTDYTLDTGRILWKQRILK